jgi:hypothetical protein
MAPDGWNKPWPFGVLLFGLLMLLLAVIGTFTGTAYGKGSRAYRATEPGTYWTLLAVQYLSGAFFIWWWANGMPRW